MNKERQNESECWRYIANNRRGNQKYKSERERKVSMGKEERHLKTREL